MTGISRTDTSAVEPRYLAALETERAQWWDADNFDMWKTLYISEYARGFDILDTIRSHTADFEVRGARVLDIGCGDAGALIAFAECGAICSGIELNDRSLERGRIRAREHGVTVSLTKGVAEALPFGAGRFDLVMLDNVFEHVHDQRQTLAEVRRVLAPGGLLYLVTPKPFSLHSVWADPHYGLAGLVLMPRRMQIWYFESVRGGGRGAYDVGTIPTRRAALRLLRRAGFSLLAAPRELWVRYLRNRIAVPDDVRPGIKRRIAAYLARRQWPFANPLARWFWDVAVGSNIFLARRD